LVLDPCVLNLSKHSVQYLDGIICGTVDDANDSVTYGTDDGILDIVTPSIIICRILYMIISL